MDGYTLRYVGDQALSVEFEEEISLPVNRKVTALYQALAACRIPGVGEVRRTQLLKHFKSVRAVREASLEELEKAVPRNTARAVYGYFHESEE